METENAENEKPEKKPQVDLKNQIQTFRKEFNKHLATFITGAFSFVAALLWRDAITNSLNSIPVKDFIKNNIPFIGQHGMSYIIAFVVTIIAVIAILIISKLLKVEEDKK